MPMLSPFRILEILLCSLLGFLPFALLMIYPFRNRLRFGGGLTAGLTAAASLLHMACDLAAGMGYLSNTGVAVLLNTVVKILLCLALVKGSVGKAAFAALSAAALAIVISALTKFVENLLFPAQAADIYRWSYLLICAVLELLLLIPCGLMLAKQLAPTLLSASDAPWNTACVIPGAVVIVGCCLMFFGVPAWLPAVILLVLTVIGSILTVRMLKQAGVTPVTVELDLESASKPEKHSEPAPQPEKVSDSPKKVKEILLPKPEIKKATPPASKAEPLPAQLEATQYDNLRARIAESERYHEELRRHIDTMSYHLNNQDFEKLQAQFTALQTQFPKNTPVIYCDNTAVSPVLAYFSQQAAYCGTKLVCDVQLPQQAAEINEDLALLVGNLLDNAVDACARQRSSDRRIWITCRTDRHAITLTVENTYEIPIRQDEQGNYLSSKHPGCGTGLQVCRQIVQRRKGDITLSDANNICKVEATLKV